VRINRMLLFFLMVAIVVYFTLIWRELDRRPSFWEGLLLFVAFYFIALVWHEFGHFLSFARNKVKRRGILLFFLHFLKEGGRYRVRIRFNLITFLGGMVVPDIPSVEDEASFGQYRRAFLRAIAAGPRASLLLLVIAWLFHFATLFSGLAGFWTVIGFIGALSLTLITLMILLVSSLENEFAVGDIRAKERLAEDDFFAALQLYQSYLYSSDPARFRKRSRYLADRIDQALAERLKERDFSHFTLEALHMRLMAHLAGEEDITPEVRDYLMSIYENDILVDSRLEIAHVLGHRMVVFLREHDALETAESFYRRIRSNRHPDPGAGEYLRRQAEHALGMADHGDHLLQAENIRYSILHPVLAYFEGYTRDDLLLNQRLVDASERQRT